MTRECHVRICERLGVKLPGPTRQRCGSGASPIRGDEAISLIGVEIDYCAGLSGHPPPTIPLSLTWNKYRRPCGASPTNIVAEGIKTPEQLDFLRLRTIHLTLAPFVLRDEIIFR
jgi:hypothetical protein